MSSTTATVLLAVILALPVASVQAVHWTLSYEGVDDSVARTLEDDGAVVNAPGDILDGQRNRVTPAGATPGDGSLFLDARVARRIGDCCTPTLGTDFYLDAALAPYGGRSDILVPGAHDVSAWFGQWLDLNADLVIDDIHDAVGDARDEFEWRGLAMGDSLAMRAFRTPGSGHDRTSYDYVDLVDRTALANPEQGWTEGFITIYDSPLIQKLDIVVAAGVRAVIGSEIGFDLADTNGLVDVDTYEVLNADVSNLFLAAESDSNDAIIDLYDETTAPVLDIYASIVPTALDAYTSTFQTATAIQRELNAEGQLYAPFGNEPTTLEDAFEGRATFGGEGDALGSFNTYAGYADSHHFYFDAIPLARAFAGAYA